MKQALLLPFLMLFAVALFSQQKITWVSSSSQKQWEAHKDAVTAKAVANPDVTIQLNNTRQTIEGFGTCFNELGWTSLGMISATDRENIMKELFSPGIGANFTICRMPIGANDFSRNWYSYDEADGDFEMRHFNIDNDLQTLVPFIKNAQQYNPALKLWASPWSPPSWMKYNHHYAGRSVLGNVNFKSEEYGMDLAGINNGLAKDKEGQEGTDMFIQEEKYYKAYALYISKFIEAYQQQHINIAMVMPQNEFNSAQVFPSCTWTAAGLAKFIGYLGPQMKALNVDVFFGTMERANDKLVDTILINAESSKYIKGVGFQWAGKGAIGAIHKQYPKLALYQSEQECGNGKNDWKYCVYAWSLMRHYLDNGANAYMYWNTSLKDGGISTWGWKQNSLVSVDTARKTYRYNYEYYLIKHVSHFVKPGAKKLTTSGSFENMLAFINPDKSVVIIVYNETGLAKTININVGERSFSPMLQPATFNTFVINSN